MKIKTSHQNLWDRTEILKEKFIALNAYIRKKKKTYKINYLAFCLQKLEK